MTCNDPATTGTKDFRTVHGWTSNAAGDSVRVSALISADIDDVSAVRALIEEMSLAVSIDISDFMIALAKADQERNADVSAGHAGRPKDRQSWVEETGLDFPRLARMLAVRRAVHPGNGSYVRACRETVLAARKITGKHRPTEAQITRLAEKLRQAHRIR